MLFHYNTHSKTCSLYKVHKTAKGLTGITTKGFVSLVPNMAMGRLSDEKIKHCGLYKLLQQEDSVMAEREFLIEDDLRELGAKFPTFQVCYGGTGERAFLRDNTKRLWTKQLRNSPNPFCEACVTVSASRYEAANNKKPGYQTFTATKCAKCCRGRRRFMCG